jgi:hypothetical protein
VERDLALSKELLVEKYKDRLEESYKVIFLSMKEYCLHIYLIYSS